jgi:hypothetical protein
LRSASTTPKPVLVEDRAYAGVTGD